MYLLTIEVVITYIPKLFDSPFMKWSNFNSLLLGCMLYLVTASKKEYGKEK